MTVFTLLRLALRRWYIVLVGAVLLGFAASALNGTQGVYFAQTDVLFLADEAATGGNPLQNQSDSVIQFASVVQQAVGSGSVNLRLSSPTATLHGSGVRRGYVARLADAGGQWQSSFNRAVIKVEVVDSSPERVRATLDTVLARIANETQKVQRSAGIGAASFVTVDSASQDVSIGYMGSTRGSRIRGLAVAALLGAGITLAAVVAVDRALQRRRESRVRRRPARRRGGATSAARPAEA